MGIEDYSMGQRMALVLRTTLTRFTITLHDLRRLIVQAKDEELRRRPPDDLREVEKLISWRHSASLVKRIERAAEDAFTGVIAYFDSLEADAPSGPREGQDFLRYPAAFEYIVAALTMKVTRDRVQEFWRMVAVADEDPDGTRYAMLWLQWKYAPPLPDRLATALLPTLTAAFEEVLGAIFRLRLNVHPGEVKEKRIAIKTLSLYEPGDLQLRAIDDKVRELIRKSPAGWADQTQRDIQLDVRTTGLHWEQLEEVFARRDVLVHAGGRVDAQYMERTHSSDAELGQSLFCDEEYFAAALSALDETAQFLVAAYFAKLTTTGPDPAELAATLILRFLQGKRWDDALRLAEIVLSGRDIDKVSAEVRVNWWMARRETGEGVDGIREEVEGWSPPNGEARYRLAKAALLFDDNRVRRILQEQHRGAKPLGPIVEDWPLIEVMCDRHPNLRSLLTARPPTRPPQRRRRRH